jgi:acyl-CoA hydrolase
MGDVVFEYFPKMGDLLELTARPVYTGNTSLDMALHVVAEFNSVFVGNGDDTGEVKGGDGTSTTYRMVVCEAVFTYVTTRGPNGEKRLCPPLVVPPVDGRLVGLGCEQFKWDKKIAQYRKALVKVERSNKSFNDDASSSTLCTPTRGFDLEMTEVVLPAHQNHMGHTFGGVVMAWMAGQGCLGCRSTVVKA